MVHTVSWMVASTKEAGKRENRRGKQMFSGLGNSDQHDLLQIWDTNLARWGLLCGCMGRRDASGMGSLLLEQRKLLSGDQHCDSPSPQGRVVANVMEGQALHFRWGDGAKFQCTELKDCFRQGSIGREE